MRPSAFSKALVLGALLASASAGADPSADPTLKRESYVTLTSTITQDALPSAFAAPPWSETRALSLRDQPRDAGFLHALFAQPAMAHLEQLDLSGVAVGRDGAEALAGATLPSLRVLTLSDSALGDAGAQALAKARLPALEELRLDQAGLGADGGCALAEADWPALKRLSVAGASDLWERGPKPFLGSHGFAALVGSGALAGLEELSAPLNAVGSKGAKALAKATQLTALKVVNLRANDIDDAGAEALLGAPHLAGLERLDLSDNPISSAMKARFRERFGDRVKF